MSDMPRRFLLRGRTISAEELEEQKQAAERRAAIVRQPGEGIHEYVRRVSHGTLQIISTTDLNSLNDRLSSALMELQVLRRQARVWTATQAAEQSIQRSLSLRGLAVDVEERLMVGGPMDGRIMQFSGNPNSFRVGDTEAMSALDISDIRGNVSRSVAERRTQFTYLLVRRADGIPLMLEQRLMNAPPSVQESYVARAMEMAGLA